MVIFTSFRSSNDSTEASFSFSKVSYFKQMTVIAFGDYYLSALLFSYLHTFHSKWVKLRERGNTIRNKCNIIWRFRKERWCLVKEAYDFFFFQKTELPPTFPGGANSLQGGRDFEIKGFENTLNEITIVPQILIQLNSWFQYHNLWFVLPHLINQYGWIYLAIFRRKQLWYNIPRYFYQIYLQQKMVKGEASTKTFIFSFERKIEKN